MNVNQIAALPLPLRVYTLALLVICTVGCWVFVGRYWQKHRWWTNDVGRHLIAFSGCLGLFFVYFGVLAFWPSMPTGLRIGLRTGLFTLLTAIIVWRVVLFERVERVQRKKRAEARRRGEGGER